MNRTILLGIVWLFCSSVAFAIKPQPLVYNGDTLPQSSEFKRRQCGKLSTKLAFPEVSGIACSRVTPGYIWMQSDDVESYIIATREKGDSCFMKVKFSKKIRWDWEDMSGGVFEGKNYLFIGAFGDNEHTDSNYSIVYFEEPAIEPGKSSVTVTPSAIKFVYPDGKLHNCEALMYDNQEQMLYIITKVYYDVCQVFSLPFRLDYGDETQTLTYICDLGVRSDLGAGTNPSRGFHLVTAADISPDGKYVLIKNHNNITAVFSWILYWEREENESIAETVQRQPVVLDCYQNESQGEAICWLDSDTFYTTSDADADWNPPIYKYTRQGSQGISNVSDTNNKQRNLVMIDNVLYVRQAESLYSLDGRKVK